MDIWKKVSFNLGSEEWIELRKMEGWLCVCVCVCVRGVPQTKVRGEDKRKTMTTHTEALSGKQLGWSAWDWKGGNKAEKPHT